MSERSSRAVREANKVFKPAQPKTTEYESLQTAFHDNRERLKTERLARESAASENRKEGAHSRSGEG